MSKQPLKEMALRQLTNRSFFLIFTLVATSAAMAYAVEIDPVAIAQQTEKMGIVGVLVVVIVLQAIGLLYLLRLLGTKIISIIEENSKTTQQMIEAIEHCKKAKE
jgi:hypothetical protein